MKNRSRGMRGTAHVIHEGLQNNLDIRKKIFEIGQSTLAISNNEESHLSDIASFINHQATLLNELSEELFKRHTVEKQNGVKDEYDALKALLPLAETGYNHNAMGKHEDLLKEDRSALANSRKLLGE